MMKRYDMIVVGAGPAGLSAAIEAAKKGMHVVVYDENAKPGGQLFKQIHKFFGSKEHKAKIRGFHIGEELLAEAAELGVEVVLNAIVIGIFPEKEVTVKVEDHVIHVKGDTILIATGASENMVTFPGWTLPGVLGAGAADVLLKSASMLPEGPVVLCGNGPLILQTVVHLKHFGIPIAGVALTGSPASLFKAALRMPGALLRPQYLLHGMGMGLRTFFGAPCPPAANDISIRRDGETLTVDFTSFGKRKSLQGTAVLLHEGVVPETRITRLARCRHAWNPRQRYWHAETDVWGKTNVCGIRVAGDSAGVRGADAAIASGEAVALDICRELGALTLETRDRLAKAALFRLYRCDAMQPFMETFFAPSPSALLPADDAVVCRCEELTAGELRRTIEAGCYSPDGLKSQARPGMGTCQGRMCSAAVAEMIAHAHGLPIETLPPYHAQPPLFPLPLEELASMSIPPEGL
mgnify:CR=1 FL=1